MNITEDKKSNHLNLMLMNSSPGILDEDAFEIKIEVVENGSLQLHTQSYQRLFTMTKGAKQNMEVTLNDNATFTYLPHPSVPHRDSIFKAKNKIYLGNNCKLIWGEIITCGRILKDEVFTFSKYHNSTEIFLNRRLIIKENIVMQPSFINPSKMGQLEGYTHQASLLIIDETIDTDLFTNEVNDYLQQQNEIDFGISTTHTNGIIIRILGYKGEPLFNFLNHIAALAKALKPEIYVA
jgi:urease accessory protein